MYFVSFCEYIAQLLELLSTISQIIKLTHRKPVQTFFNARFDCQKKGRFSILETSLGYKKKAAKAQMIKLAGINRK